MMPRRNRFKLKRRSVRLRIGNQRFFLTINDRMLYECGRVREMAHASLMAMENGGSLEDALCSVRSNMLMCIDSILGEGTAKTLGCEDKYSVLDLIALLSFITDRITSAKLSEKI